MNTEIPTTNEISQPGVLLKLEREKRGITTKQIAAVLNLPERFISYLEAGEFNQLPGSTFSRGYIRNYGKYLELENIEELVELFDYYTVGEAKETKVLDFKQIKRIKNISNSIYWLVSFVLCLILAGIIFLVWQHYTSASDSNVSVAANNSSVIADPLQSNILGSTAVDSEIPLGDDNNRPITIPLNQDTNLASQEITSISLAEADNASATTDVNVVMQSKPNETEANETTSITQAELDTLTKKGEGRITASFTSNCWVSITDSSGKVLVSKLFVANTELNITGKAPLEMVLGAPTAASVTYNGKPVKISQIVGTSHRIKLGK